MMSTKEVATLLGCTSRNVTLLVTKGRLKPANQHSRFFIFDEVQVLNYQNQRDGRKKTNF